MLGSSLEVGLSSVAGPSLARAVLAVLHVCDNSRDAEVIRDAMVDKRSARHTEACVIDGQG